MHPIHNMCYWLVTAPKEGVHPQCSWPCLTCSDGHPGKPMEASEKWSKRTDRAWTCLPRKSRKSVSVWALWIFSHSWNLRPNFHQPSPHTVKPPACCNKQAASRHSAEDANCWEPRMVLIPHVFGVGMFSSECLLLSNYSSSRLHHLLGNIVL